MAPDRLVNLVHHRLYAESDQDQRDHLDDALQEAEDAWAELANPAGTDARPAGAPAWWNEETAGRETLAAAKALPRPRVPTGVPSPAPGPGAA